MSDILNPGNIVLLDGHTVALVVRNQSNKTSQFLSLTSYSKTRTFLKEMSPVLIGTTNNTRYYDEIKLLLRANEILFILQELAKEQVDERP